MEVTTDVLKLPGGAPDVPGRVVRILETEPVVCVHVLPIALCADVRLVEIRATFQSRDSDTIQVEIFTVKLEKFH